MRSSTDNVSFLDIKDPAGRSTLVKEYVTAMKTVKQRNMVNREMKLAIGDELQTLFHPIINATKQASEETRKELEPLKEPLTGIDRDLTAQRVEARPPPPSKNVDITFGIYMRQHGQLVMGNKVVQLNGNKETLNVGDTEYKFTPGVEVLNIHEFHNIILMIIEYINLLLHRPRLDHSRIRQVRLDNTLQGNIRICLGEWLYLEKG